MPEPTAFEKANEKLHPVETQWHYADMTAHGFVCADPPQKGFVRGYTYTHPTIPRKVYINTGVNADYWNDDAGVGGYWDSLKPYLQKLTA